MTKEEVPQQYELFTGELVDVRTRTQKREADEREKPQQTELFPQREIAQFGVRARPQFSLSSHTKLVLITEDPRTPEEIEYDRLKEAEKRTYLLFPDPVPMSSDGDKEKMVIESIACPIVGYRALHRRMSVHLRTR